MKHANRSWKWSLPWVWLENVFRPQKSFTSVYMLVLERDRRSSLTEGSEFRPLVRCPSSCCHGLLGSSESPNSGRIGQWKGPRIHKLQLILDLILNRGISSQCDEAPFCLTVRWGLWSAFCALLPSPFTFFPHVLLFNTWTVLGTVPFWGFRTCVESKSSFYSCVQDWALLASYSELAHICLRVESDVPRELEVEPRPSPVPAVNFQALISRHKSLMQFNNKSHY